MAVISSGPGGVDKAWGTATQTAGLQTSWHPAQTWACLEKSLPIKIGKTWEKVAWWRVIRRKRSTAKTVNSSSPRTWRLKSARDLEVGCQAGHIPCNLPHHQAPFFAQTIHTFFPAPGRNASTWVNPPIHTLQPGSLSSMGRVTSSRKPSLPVTPPQANIHTDHTKKHIQQKSGAQPQESTCLGSNADCKMYTLCGLGQVLRGITKCHRTHPTGPSRGSNELLYLKHLGTMLDT